MPTDPLFTVEQITKALWASAGIKSVAAKKLGVAPSTMSGYVSRYPELNKVIEEIREKTIDLAESKLLQHINDGNLTAIIFYLKCQAKHRGYVQTSKVEHTGQVTMINFKDVPLEEVERIAGAAGARALPGQGGQGGKNGSEKESV
jgi:hypothetical protein